MLLVLPLSTSPYGFGNRCIPLYLDTTDKQYTDMKINFLRGYVSKNGNPTFVHTVQGTETEIANYKAVLGENFREDEELGLPLYFDSRRQADGTSLALRRDGKKFYAETELLEAAVQREVNKLQALSHVLNKGTAINPRLLAALGIAE